MNYVTCVKTVYAELTEGSQYRVYGKSLTGVIIRNDIGLLVTYEHALFGGI